MQTLCAAILLMLSLFGLRLEVAYGNEIQLFNFPWNGTKMSVSRETLLVNWIAKPDSRNDGALPVVTGGDIILMRPSSLGGIRPARHLGNIQQRTLFWASFERGYWEAAKHHDAWPQNAALHLQYLVSGTTLPVDDGYAATIAVRLLAMFRKAHIPDTSILVGVLQPDGRIGPVGLLPQKLQLLLPYAQKLYIPSGQLATLDPIFMGRFQQRVTIEEVETIEQAYQLMAPPR